MIPCRISKDKTELVVLEDTTVEWTYQGTTFRRTLPKGYRYAPGAGHLTPLLLALIGRPLGLWQASALHDYLYDEIEERPREAVPRVVADAALTADPKDPRWLRQTAFWVVRAVGLIPWLGGRGE